MVPVGNKDLGNRRRPVGCPYLQKNVTQTPIAQSVLNISASFSVSRARIAASAPTATN